MQRGCKLLAINNFVVELWLHSLSILSKLICARLHKPWLLAIGSWLFSLLIAHSSLLFRV